jgi:hypothetical protein
MGMILQQASTEDDVAGYGIIAPQLLATGLTERGIIVVGGRAGGAPALGVRQGIIIIGGRGR